MCRKMPTYLQHHPVIQAEGGGDKCRCKSQLRSHEHRLEQVNCRKGVIAGTVFDGRQEAGQASVSCWRSKKDGQVFYERGPHGTCQTYVGQAPAASQHVSMYIEAGIGPGRCPILQHCQWPCSVGPETHALLWNHQEPLKKRGVRHLGQKTPTVLPKGHNVEASCFESHTVLLAQLCEQVSKSTGYLHQDHCLQLNVRQNSMSFELA